MKIKTTIGTKTFTHESYDELLVAIDKDLKDGGEQLKRAEEEVRKKVKELIRPLKKQVIALKRASEYYRDPSKFQPLQQ